MHRKYCEKCGFSTYDDEYNFCPKCSAKLIDSFETFIKELVDKFNGEYVVKCERCNECFPKGYKTCPYCQNDLVKQDIFSIDWDEKKVVSRFMEFQGSATFGDLYTHYTAHWTMFPPGSPPPEHKFYSDTLEYVEEYFKSDSSKYCRRCDKMRNSKLEFCPDCGDELVHFKESEALAMARDLCESHKIKRCGDCIEEYRQDFKYCPVCSKPLKEESLFWIDGELIKTYWNKKEVSMPIDEYYKQEMSIAYDAPLPVNMVRLKLTLKKEFDDELEKSFSIRGLKAPNKLTYPQMEKLVSNLQSYEYRSLGFMNSEIIFMNFLMDLEELKEHYPNIFVIELRKDLFYVYVCEGPILWG